MQAAARGEDEQRAPDGGVQLLLAKGDLLSCDIGLEDELDVSQCARLPLRALRRGSRCLPRARRA
jgi:hypothetical protein